MPNSNGETDGRPAGEDPHLGAENPGERPPSPRGQQALLDCDGSQGEPRAHQHRVLRILAELRAVFPVGPRVASLSESRLKPLDGYDDLQLLPKLGCSRAGNSTFRERPPNPGPSGGSCGECLRKSVPCVSSVARGNAPRGTTSGSPVAVVFPVPVPSDTGEDPRRSGIRGGRLRDRLRAPLLPKG